MARSRYRFAAPVVVAALIGTGAAVVPKLDAAAAPHLPTVSAQQLVAKAVSEKVDHLSGAIRWDADLGLPSVSELTGGDGQTVSSASGFDPTSLASGSQTFDVWVAGSQRQRVAIPGSLEETDVVRDGSQAWVWQSSTAHVTHYVLKRAGGQEATVPASNATSAQDLNPQTVASHILADLNLSTTSVSVAPSETVAGRSAYVLRLAPDRSVTGNRDSTVGSIEIAVDASTGLPLRVTVWAAGQSQPALELGYTSISYSMPSSHDLAPPTGETTTTKVIEPAGPHHQAAGSLGHRIDLIGSDWGSIANVAAGSAAGRLYSATTAVSGSWGSGRLLSSTLVNALLLPDGRALVGFVTPAALEQAAARIGS
jgi:outer membrane lipoprotein-sorting protein